jgi:hypothetical protein
MERGIGEILISLTEGLMPFLGPLRCILAGIPWISYPKIRPAINQVLYPHNTHCINREKAGICAISYLLSHYEIHAATHCKIHIGTAIASAITAPKPNKNPSIPSIAPINMASPILLSIFYNGHIS